MNQDLVTVLQNNKVAVIPTDTIYGIVGSALNSETVEKIYRLRRRALNKPFIILISEISDLGKFNIKLTDKQREFLQKHWPNPLSVVLPIESERFKYLHRGKNSLAFRIPKHQELLKILKKVGPLVAPSANFEGEKVAETIDEAKKYFGDSLGIYLDKGKLLSVPSTIVELSEKGEAKVLRQGGYRV